MTTTSSLLLAHSKFKADCMHDSELESSRNVDCSWTVEGIKSSPNINRLNNQNLKNITYQDHDYGVSSYTESTRNQLNANIDNFAASVLSSPSSSSSSSTMMTTVGMSNYKITSTQYIRFNNSRWSCLDDDDDENDSNGYHSDDVATLKPSSIGNHTSNADVTRCICDMKHDDGFMISCDRCQVWQHIICMEISKNKIPDKYFCEMCLPRSINQTRAKLLQKKYNDENLLKKKLKPRHRGQSKPIKDLQEGDGSQTQFNSNQNENDCLMGHDAHEPQTDCSERNGSTLNDQEACQTHYLTTYDEVSGNVYSNALIGLLDNFKKIQNQTVKQNEYNLKNQININCLNLIKNRQPWRLKTNSPIKQNQIVIEFIGKITCKNESNGNPASKPPGLSPFVNFYSLNGLNLCIDCSFIGNISRFIRKSCTPNCCLKHTFDSSGQIRFIIISISNIPKNVELTLQYESIYDPKYCVCNCNKSTCFLKNAVKDQDLKRRTNKKKANTITGPPSIPINGQKTQEVVSDKAISNGILKPLETDNRKSTSENDYLKSLKNENETVLSNKSQLTREDRKLISYVKVIEKLERQSKRKRDSKKPEADTQMESTNELRTDSKKQTENFVDNSTCLRRKSDDLSNGGHCNNRELIWQAKVSKEPKTNSNSKENRKNMANKDSMQAQNSKRQHKQQEQRELASDQKMPKLNECTDSTKDERPYNTNIDEKNENILQLNTNVINSGNNLPVRNELLVDHDFKSKKHMASVYNQLKSRDDYSFVHLTIEPRHTLSLLKRDLPTNKIPYNNLASSEKRSDLGSWSNACIETLNNRYAQKIEYQGKNKPKNRWLKCFLLEQSLEKTTQSASGYLYQCISLDNSINQSDTLSPISDFSDSIFNTAPLKKRRHIFNELMLDDNYHQMQQKTIHENKFEHYQAMQQFQLLSHPFLYSSLLINNTESNYVNATMPLVCNTTNVMLANENSYDMKQYASQYSACQADQSETLSPGLIPNDNSKSENEPQKRKKVSLAEYRQRKEVGSLLSPHEETQGKTESNFIFNTISNVALLSSDQNPIEEKETAAIDGCATMCDYEANKKLTEYELQTMSNHDSSLPEPETISIVNDYHERIKSETASETELEDNIREQIVKSPAFSLISSSSSIFSSDSEYEEIESKDKNQIVSTDPLLADDLLVKSPARKRKRRTSIYSAVSSSSLSSDSSLSSEDGELTPKNTLENTSIYGYKAKTETISDLETISNPTSCDNSPVRSLNSNDVENKDRAWQHVNNTNRHISRRSPFESNYSHRKHRYYQESPNSFNSKQLMYKNNRLAYHQNYRKPNIHNQRFPSYDNNTQHGLFADSNQSYNYYRHTYESHQTPYLQNPGSIEQKEQETQISSSLKSAQCSMSTSQFYYQNYNNKYTNNNNNQTSNNSSSSMSRHCYYENGDLKATITSSSSTSSKSHKKNKSTSSSSLSSFALASKK